LSSSVIRGFVFVCILHIFIAFCKRIFMLSGSSFYPDFSIYFIIRYSLSPYTFCNLGGNALTNLFKDIYLFRDMYYYSGIFILMIKSGSKSSLLNEDTEFLILLVIRLKRYCYYLSRIIFFLFFIFLSSKLFLASIYVFIEFKILFSNFKLTN